MLHLKLLQGAIPRPPISRVNHPSYPGGSPSCMRPPEYLVLEALILHAAARPFPFWQFAGLEGHFVSHSPNIQVPNKYRRAINFTLNPCGAVYLAMASYT